MVCSAGFLNITRRDASGKIAIFGMEMSDIVALEAVFPARARHGRV